MTAGVQCDTCRSFTPLPDSRWLCLASYPDQGTGFAGLLASLGGPSEAVSATFCGWACLAQYAVARALVEGQPAGEES